MSIIDRPVESVMSEGEIVEIKRAIKLEETHKETHFELPP